MTMPTMTSIRPTPRCARRRSGSRACVHVFLPICAVIRTWWRSVSPGSCQNTVTTTLRLCGDRPGCVRSTSGALAPVADGSRLAAWVCQAVSFGPPVPNCVIQSAGCRRPHVADHGVGEIGGFRPIPGVVGRADGARQDSDQAENAEREDEDRDQRLRAGSFRPGAARGRCARSAGVVISAGPRVGRHQRRERRVGVAHPDPVQVVDVDAQRARFAG